MSPHTPHFAYINGHHLIYFETTFVKWHTLPTAAFTTTEMDNYIYDMANTVFVRDNGRDLKFISDMHATVMELTCRCSVRGEQIKQLECFVGSIVASACMEMLCGIQDEELEKNRTLMRLITETQLQVLKKSSFLAMMRKKY